MGSGSIARNFTEVGVSNLGIGHEDEECKSTENGSTLHSGNITAMVIQQPPRRNRLIQERNRPLYIKGKLTIISKSNTLYHAQ